MEPVSIVLKVWNASQVVKLCLETLLANTDSPFELIIVDNGSKPRLKDYLIKLAQNDGRIHLIKNSKNMGPGYANRQGVALASHRLICLLDSDVLVPPGWLARLVDEFRSIPNLKMLAPLQPEERLIHPKPLFEKDARQSWYEIQSQSPHLPPLEQFLIFSHGLDIRAFEVAVLQINPAKTQLITAPPDFLSGCCLLVDREFIESAGGIADPEFQTYGSEDVDLCWRVAEKGGEVGKTSKVYVHHFLGSSLRDNQVDRRSVLAKANQILYRKWKERLLRQVKEKNQEGIELVSYLESHFIYSALAHNTPFIDDLRIMLDRTGIPEDIVWRK